jgi:hypothetical protein
LVLLSASVVRAQPPSELPKGDAGAAQVLELADCIRMALENQPRVAGQRASLAAAEDGRRALEALRFAALIDPELPFRRRQATLGVAAAAAAVEQAERETVYAVTRTYFTVLFAREQDRVARGVVDRLTAIHDSADKQLKGGARDINATDVARAKVYLQLAKTRQIQAAHGILRAAAALREAMGVSCDLPLQIAVRPLPLVDLPLTRQDVVNRALARRPELARAILFADIVCVEVEAQGVCVHKKMDTFAVGADIHSILVPQGAHNGEYRPGAAAPEMPVLLAGSRADRVKHAQTLHARALAVVDVTRNLIALEAEDAFLRWEEATKQIAEARVAAETGEQMADDLAKDFAAAAKVKVEEVINARVLASQARASYNDYVHKQILALADIERITAGTICPVWFEIVRPK